MDITDLTAEMHAFVEAQGWYEPDSPHPQTPSNLAKSLVIEASEVLELFQWHEQADPEALGSELADVFLYLLQLADSSGIDLAQATRAKLQRNRARSW